jgi:hypothetical protein
MSVKRSGEINATAVSRDGRDLGLLQTLATAVAGAGAVGSVGLMLWVGRRNSSLVLMILFAIWVLSPFIALLWANRVSRRWPAFTRKALYGLMLILPLVSLAIYGSVAIWPPSSTSAFMFVVLPPCSWLLIGIVIPIAALISRNLPHRGAAPRS